jgi:hypothetical protein
MIFKQKKQLVSLKNNKFIVQCKINKLYQCLKNNNQTLILPKILINHHLSNKNLQWMLPQHLLHKIKKVNITGANTAANTKKLYNVKLNKTANTCLTTEKMILLCDQLVIKKVLGLLVGLQQKL